MIAEFIEAMSEAGIVTHADLIADGQLQRFYIEGDRRDSKNGWAVLHNDGIAAGAFGNWKTGEQYTWREKSQGAMTTAEREIQRRAIESAKAIRVADIKEKRGKAAAEAQSQIVALQFEAGQHRYLRDKGIEPCGVRSDGVNLVIPLYDAGGRIHSLQTIAPNGTKKFLANGAISGHYYPIGNPSNILYIVEGFATGATVHKATGQAVAVAFNAGNLEPVASALRAKYVDIDIVIAGDDDTTPGNPGRTKAEYAAYRVNGKVAVPDFGNNRPLGVSDFNDLAALHDLDMVSEQLQRAHSPQKVDPCLDAPLPLPGGLPDVPVFDLAMLPEALRPWVGDIAERLQCPLDYPSVAFVTALAGVIGKKIGVRPKQQDDWTVVPNLWGAIVGPPGVQKSPAVSEVFAPLRALEAGARQKYENDVEAFEIDAMVAAAEKKALQEKIAKAVKAGDDPREIALAHTSPDKPEPVRRRYLTNDTTVEKLGELLADSPNGLMVFRDELAGFLRDLDKQGRESARAFFLEAWNGNGRFTFDRIGRGTVDVEACCVSLLGTIQPGPLGDYISSAMKGGRGDDGLIQRFQLLVWPDVSGEWKNVDRWPNTTAKQQADELFTRLDDTDPATFGCEFDGDAAFLRFDAAAQAIFDGWRETLEHRLRGDDIAPVLVSHLSKYRSLIPSLALIFHLADSPGGGPVCEEALIRACAWGEYLEGHAVRLYSTAIDADMAAARELDKRIMKGDVPSPFSARDVYRKHWRLLDKESTGKALEILEDYNRVSSDTVVTAGRTATIWNVNPKLVRAV